MTIQESTHADAYGNADTRMICWGTKADVDAASRCRYCGAPDRVRIGVDDNHSMGLMMMHQCLERLPNGDLLLHPSELVLGSR